MEKRRLQINSYPARYANNQRQAGKTHKKKTSNFPTFMLVSLSIPSRICSYVLQSRPVLFSALAHASRLKSTIHVLKYASEHEEKETFIAYVEGAVRRKSDEECEGVADKGVGIYVHILFLDLHSHTQKGRL